MFYEQLNLFTEVTRVICRESLNALPLSFSLTHQHLPPHNTHTQNQTPKQHHCLFTAIFGGINQSIVTDYLLFEDLLQDSKGKLYIEALGIILTVMKPL
jgi:hypothetical protein